MKDWYQMNEEELLKYLDASLDGLSSKQVQERINKYGENKLEESKKDSIFMIFIKQFADLLVVILLIAAIISLFTKDVKSAGVIIAVLILNATLGTWQSVVANKSLDALKAMSSPHVKVKRDGNIHQLASKEIVPGDVVLLEAGDMICADARLIDEASLQVNESALTGESLPIDKKVDVISKASLADRINMVYSGTLVTAGRGEAIVVATGMQSELGKIATLMNDTKAKRTPLQKTIDRFSKRLAIGILLISAIVLALQLYRGTPLMEALLFAVALAVAAIPEALGSIITIVQAMGMRKMAEEQAIVKELSAVETLGSVSVICSDKTGTLTQNKMTVADVYLDHERIDPNNLSLEKKIHRRFLYACVLANDASIVEGEGIGDPTEYALIDMYHHVKGIRHPQSGHLLSERMVRDLLPRIDEVPFDSERKLMSTRHNMKGKMTIFTKGAVDVLLNRCKSIMTSEGVRAITKEDIEAIMKMNHSFSNDGLRVLAFAYKESKEKLTLSSENGYTFIGLVSLIDPPRHSALEAVAQAKAAGIRTVMITGDHKDTAVAIGKKIGLFSEGDKAVTGEELDEMSDETLAREIATISVYARVSPQHKIRIVEAWQKSGQIVSMTGDGVNDAPALKKADIGVAMGITGTEVSKDAASMILADDHFATIIKAVRNGRVIYDNIKNAILFLLSGNLSAILCVLMTSLLSLPLPFYAVQLLFINLVTDSLPALAIGVEPGHEVMNRKPRDPHASLMDKAFIQTMIIQALLLFVFVMSSYYVGLSSSFAHASSMAFLTLTLARLFHGLNSRGKESLYRLGLKNKYCIYAIGVGIVLVMGVSLTDYGRMLFKVERLSYMQWGAVILFALLPTILIQLYRLIREYQS